MQVKDEDEEKEVKEEAEAEEKVTELGIQTTEAVPF